MWSFLWEKNVLDVQFDILLEQYGCMRENGCVLDA